MQKLSLATKSKIVIPIIYLELVLLLFAFTWPINPQLHHSSGVVITIAAFVFWLIARVQLGNAFTIAPAAKFIVSNGLYSKLRHPVYYFSIVALAGLSIYIWQWPMLLLLALFIFAQIYRMKREEELLLRQFGKDYVAYKNSTWL